MAEGEKMKVALYARVSKDEAGQDGRLQNPENQLIQQRKFCEAMGWTVSAEFVDRSSGGDSNRPSFLAMLGRVRQGHFDLILVWRVDRFSREGIPNTMGYIKQLRQYNTALKSIEESYVDTRQEGISELILSILAWAAEAERKKISDNTIAGLKRARAEGKRLGRHPNGCDCPKHRGKTPPSLLYK